MVSITLTEATLRQISLFQDLTGVMAIDCMDSGERVTLVIREGQVGKAVGRGGENINRLRRFFNKEVHVVEYNPDPSVFIKNVFRNYDVRDVDLQEKDGKLHAVVSVNPTKKGRAIGREGRNLRLAREIINRHHDVESVVIA
ncbi:MAG: NusA-like transcription termination signal-binding factor [Candidatus Thermoplasmatota archaeon]|nr:NusA-like transcription termination signal-binding factor [Candidatus Thermoplasmatota archaeon]